MSLESGGRADKYGNEYENRYLAKLLLRLAKEELSFVIAEPLGPNSDSVEYIAEQKGGMIKHYQCKASNTTRSTWSVLDLRNHNVFQRAKSIVLSGPNHEYVFISPLQYGELDELCKRARTNSSSQEFMEYQLSNRAIRDLFRDCVTEFQLDETNTDAQAQLVHILSRCYFEQYSWGAESLYDLEASIGATFSGKAESIRILLQNYANTTGTYGVKITTKDIVDYLQSHDISLRNYSRDESVLSRISTLNSAHWDTYQPIHNKLFHRSATEIVLDHINNGHSVILHGKAGVGKSGCLQELINHLDTKHTLYLSIKLDKHLPEDSADAFGKKLGLPESPVYCLHTLASGRPCVLILDQLDALRWTSSHSRTALSVCRELIAQANTLNHLHNANISIVFASRTFDLENDKGLKMLLDSDHNPSQLNWHKVHVDLLTEPEAIQMIGPLYHALSPRLKKLLLTPSSMFVWTMLEESQNKNQVVSVFELMNSWWLQLQAQCVAVGISSTDVVGCKEKIVDRMEQSHRFALPRVFFANEDTAVEFLISTGLLSTNATTKQISFTHQSFLDYFISSSILEQIYMGQNLCNIIGDKIDQTPIIRYRLLMVLQNLLDSDRGLFVQQVESLLRSPDVRHYFKCTVFEVIAQCDNPDITIHSLIDAWRKKSEWSQYITQVVLYGHTPFVMYLSQQAGVDLFADQMLVLLSSVSNTAPDLVTNILSAYALQNEDQDSKIFRTLCHDPTEDSDDMFKLRLMLLRNHPAFFQNFWGLSQLFEQNSTRIIEVISILLETASDKQTDHIHFSKNKKCKIYLRRYHRVFVETLFPLLCTATKDCVLSWPCHGFHDYRDWVAHSYNESTIRKITEMVKHAIEEYATTDPDACLAFVQSARYPISAVGHELITHALWCLPTTYGESAMAWLLDDFSHRIFVFTADESDYLCYTKRLISKFSPTCSMEQFIALENQINSWKESSDRMIRTYKRRCDTNKSKMYSPVYYAYWGHLQKALLPSLDSSRISQYSISLIEMLETNSWVHLPYHHCGFSGGDVKSVVSPLHGKTAGLSDARWLQIISTPSEKMDKLWHNTEYESHYIEVTHPSFARALGEQAKKEPERFAHLSLQFPQNCHSGYVREVLSALSRNEADGSVSIDLMIEVIRHIGDRQDADIAIEICRVVEEHATKLWPKEIIELVKTIAVHHPHPMNDEQSITSDTDLEHASPNTLLTYSINCPRGCALHTLSRLLWNHKEIGDSTKDTILAACNDKNSAVRYAVLSCALPYCNIDKAFAFHVFQTILNADIRAIASYECWDLLSSDYEINPKYYRTKLIDGTQSDIDDVANTAAGLLCAVAIFHKDTKALSYLKSTQFSQEQYNKICGQAIVSFDSVDSHEQSKELILHIVDSTECEIPALNKLFRKNIISIQRDEEFLIHLMQTHHSVSLAHAFIKFLYESNEEISEYACVLKSLSENFAASTDKWNTRLVMNDLMKCVVRLYDTGQDNLVIREICLNILDSIFKSNLHDIKPLADMIDNFE